MKEPVDHILRPRLPWRLESDGAMTECGYNAAKLKTITRAEHAQRIKEFGSQRCMMLTCMTCSGTADRWASWDEDPRKALGREVEWEVTRWGTRDSHGVRLLDELLAIAALIAAHPEEFAKLLADLNARRQWNDEKSKSRPKPVRPGRTL